MSSPKITRMFGFLSCEAAAVAISSVSRTARESALRGGIIVLLCAGRERIPPRRARSSRLQIEQIGDEEAARERVRRRVRHRERRTVERDRAAAVDVGEPERGAG